MLDFFAPELNPKESDEHNTTLPRETAMKDIHEQFFKKILVSLDSC